MDSYSYEKKFDVVIIGAGVIGCAIAYFLAKESDGKLKVGVIERNTVGEESSSGAAGMLAAQVECDRESPFLRMALQSRELFRSLAPDLKERTGVEIGYRPSGILSLAYTLEQDEELKNRLLWQKQSGLECEWWTDSQVSSQFPFLEKSYRAGFWAPQEGQVSSSRLALAFSESAKKMGVEFFEYESFDSVNLQNERLDFVETNVSKFIAGKFIFAAGSWTGKLLNGLVPVEPVKGQILIFQMPEKWPWRNQWESPVYAGKTPGHDPISCYFVPKMDGHIFLGATMENRGFDKSENKIATQRMADYATQIFPDLASFPFKGVWVGLRPGSPDGLPLMGLVPGKQNVYVASGHFRNGVLLAPITGKLFSDLIVRENHSALLSFAPNRN